MALDVLKATRETTTGSGPSATTTTEEWYFLGSSTLYEDTVISTATGVEEADDSEKDNPKYKVSELLHKGILVPLAMTLDDGSQIRFVCERTKLSDALDLVGETYDGQEITSVRIPLKATFY